MKFLTLTEENIKQIKTLYDLKREGIISVLTTKTAKSGDVLHLIAEYVEKYDNVKVVWVTDEQIKETEKLP